MSGVTFCSAGKPMVPGLMRTPSISTSVWLLSAPRMNTEVGWPGPPVRATSTPAWKRSRSAASFAALRSMVARSITMTGASTSSSGIGTRVAVTTTAGTDAVPSAAVATDAASASASALARRTERTTDESVCMTIGPTPSARPRRAPVIRQRRQAGRAERAGYRNDLGRGPAARPPRGWSQSERPVSGLSSGRKALPASPSRASCGAVGPEPRARAMQASLDYRCGGSAGIEPASRSP